MTDMSAPAPEHYTGADIVEMLAEAAEPLSKLHWIIPGIESGDVVVERAQWVQILMALINLTTDIEDIQTKLEPLAPELTAEEFDV